MNSKECPTCGGRGEGYFGALAAGFRICPTCLGNKTVAVVRYCASCGEREGSEYAKHCCTDDNMLTD